MQTSQSRQRQRRQRGLLRSIRLEHRQLRFESLESRRVLTSNPILTVTVADGTGPGTLYDMIQVANAQAGEDRIFFAPEITSVRPAANLPWISSALTIDGENRVTIDGTNAPQHGLWINGSGVQILNLTVNNFANGYGVYFFGASNSKVQNSRLGSDQAGLVAQPNDIGVMIHNSSNIIVGTDGDGINDANEGNLISGNTNHGLQISGDNSQFNVVAGNLVGFKTGGTELLSNGAWAAVVIRDGSSFNRIGTNGDGISDVLERNVATGTNTSGFYILNAWDNTISGNYAGVDVTGSFQVGTMQGGTGMSAGATRNTIGVVDDQSPGEALEGNLFAGGMFGVTAIDSTSAYNVIKGNRLGTNALGTYPIPLNIGVILESPNNLVGTDGNGKSDVLERNIIASATEWGIRINKAEASGNRVAGNYIGTDVTGTKALGNNYAGVGIFDGASSNIIGTNGDGNQDSMEGNLISGNIGHGILIGDASSNNNVVAGNFVGTNASGTDALKNGAWSAVLLHPNSSGTRIGTNGDGVSDLAEGNLISGAAGFGIYSQADQVKISGNYIGTDITGSFAIPNTAHGIALSNGATNSIVGTDGDGSPGDSNEGNLISGNGTAGIGIDGSNTSNHRIAGNRIGTSANGLSSVSNNNGIEIVGGTQNNIIGTNGDGISDQLEGNIISGNRSHAILVASAGTTNTTIAGNLIGVDATGNSLLRNDSWTNIFLETGVTNTRIGTNGDNVSDQLERNVISGSTGNGISSRAKNTTIAGNYIGTNATGTVAIPNDSGISFFDGEQNSVIGVSGSNPESGNLISGNVNSAIVFHSNATKNHRVSGNRIGTVANGLTSLPNKNGVSLYDTSNNIIIGTNGDGIDDAIEGNLISGNLDYAVYIGASSNDNTIAGNLIGVDATGNTALRNGAWTSIFLETNATNTRIGTNGDNTSDHLERNIISGSPGNGIASRAKNTTIAGNYIGTNASGTLPIPNFTGIYLFGGEQNSIIGVNGDRSPGEANEGNLISGNPDAGIYVDGEATKTNRIAGNQIGTNASGLASIPNGFGIMLMGKSQETIVGTNGDGFSDALERNLVSGNVNHGVYLSAESFNNRVAGNWIGVDATGTKALGNQWGVRLEHTKNNIIGTNSNSIADSDERNVISGNTLEGISIVDANAIGNHFRGNFIGTDPTGTMAVANLIGVNIANGSNGNFIGTNGDGLNDANEGNVISGNTDWGIKLENTGTSNNRISGNRIGTDTAGLAPLPNRHGMMVWAQAADNIIGTNSDGVGDALEGNLISGNNEVAVVIRGNGTNGTVLAGNRIGIDATGNAKLSNKGGVSILIDEGASGTRIGTNSDNLHDALERNVISGSAGSGIGVRTNGITIAGNYIGTNSDGIAPIPNIIGIHLSQGASNNIIGSIGTATSSMNVISGNTDWGILLENTGTSNNRISGNLIGTSVNRFTPLPNGNGIGILSGASNNTIGSNDDGTNDSLEGNLISGNSSNGIYIRDANTTGNKVLGNRIGLDERYIPEGAVSWYRSEGNINDFYNRNNGSSFNGTYTQGKVGQAFRFDGGQAIIIPYDASLVPGYNSFSAELWVKTPSLENAVIIENYECGGDCPIGGANSAWTLGLTGGKAYITLRDSFQTTQFLVDSEIIADDKYHHLAMVRDIENQRVTLYVDGISVQSETLNSLQYIGDNDGEADPITLGYHRPPSINPGDAYYFTGEIDEPTIYSKALSATDVAAIYQMGSGGKKFTQALPNGVNGILIDNAPDQQIGGTSPTARNTIVGNSIANSAAIRITGSTASNNRVQGNWIGTDESGNVALGGAAGVVIDNATNNFIGTDGDGTSDGAEGNLISGINGPGVILTGSLTSNNSVAANTIGTAQDKVSPLPNNGPGILVSNQATSSKIGGPNPEFGNQISFNPVGIRIEVPTENLHTLRHNRFHQNTSIAVDLGPSGPTSNDIGDSDSVKNAPVITSVRRTNSSLIVEGFARPGTEFDLYKTLPYPNGLGQGSAFIARLFEGGLQDQDDTTGTYDASTTGNSNVGTDTTNRFRFILPLNSLQNPVAAGDSVTAIAADPTSEFGISTTVVASSLSPSELGPQSLSITNNTIAELSATGTIVGFLAADGYELRPSWEYTYSLVSGAGSDDNDAFRIVDNRLVSNRIFDYETKPTYTVRIRVTDPNNRFLESAMTIAISDAKEDGSGPYITRASVSATGVQGDKLSQNPAMSADGRYVAYTTEATNLHPQKTSSSNGVVRKDLLTGEVILVSPPTAVNARLPSISASGRYIVFGADSDFGLGDNNKTQSIFLYDAQTAKTELVTSINFVGLNGGAIANQPPYAVSADGRYVAFSNWENLSANSYRNRIYIKDMLTGISTVVAEEIDIPLYFASISADGTHVAVSRSGGARITPGVIGYSVFNLKTGARYDIPTRTTNDTQGWQASLSGDGRYLTYAQNWEIYLFDTLTGSNQRISSAYIPGGTVTAINISPSISVDGTSIAFYSSLRIDDFRYRGISTYDVATGTSKRYDTTSASNGSISTVFTSSISANGAKFAIHSDIGELVPDDTNAVRDVFIVDLHRPITTISPATSSTPESTPVGTTIASLAASDMFSNTILASYALVAGEGSSSNALFEIVGNTLKLKQPLDYETKSAHSIRVRATDPQGRSFDQVLTVDVTDVPESLVISGTPGNDAFIVTQNNANSWTIRRGTTTLHNGPIPSGTEIQILAGDGIDTLTINGSSAADTFTINSDSITLNSTAIRNANVETRTVNGLGQSDTFYINSSIQTVNGGDGADRFIMADSELTVSLVEGGIGYDTLDYSNRSTPLTHTVGSNASTNVTRFNAIESIVATSGTDELIGQNLATYWAITGENTVQITNVDFVGFENLTGGTGSDFFQLWNTNSKITGKILGGEGNDRLTAFNRENTWNLSAARGGSITDQITAFENIEILIGGTQADSFLVGPLAQFSSIDAGAGNDTVDFSTFNAVVNLSMATQSISAVGRITSVERIIGSSRQDAITGANSPNTWEVTGASTGSINGLNFESFEILRGGSNADQFNFGTSGSISQIAAGGGADTLRAANKNNSWRITGIARGTLNTTTNFTDLEHLVGGSLDDSVEMTTTGRVTGSLTGGAGTNSLSYRNYTTAVSVNVTVGVATNVPNLAPDFQILIGGAGADNLRAFAGVPSVLIGNAGNDVLTGSTGRDILIGGLGSDTLRGGGAEDILIGGSTTHDAAPSQLANLRAEWTSDRSYSERIGNLQGTAITGTPLNNGTYLRNTPTDTLLDDNAVDNLYGEDDLDWFIASLANDLLVDRIADELITDPTQS